MPPLSDKMKSSLRNKLSNLEVMISDEITMVSNDLLFHIHLRLNYLVLSKINHLQAYPLVHQPSLSSASDFFQLPVVGG